MKPGFCGPVLSWKNPFSHKGNLKNKNLHYFRPKWHQCKFRNFKMLQPKGNADDGDAQKTAHNCRLDGQRQPGHQNPYDIQEQGARPAAVTDFLSKREKTE